MTKSSLRLTAFTSLLAGGAYAIMANLGDHKFFAYGGPDFSIDTELRARVVSVEEGDLYVVADPNYNDLALKGNWLRPVPGESGTKPGDGSCWAKWSTMSGQVGSDPAAVIKLESSGVGGRPDASPGIPVVSDNGTERPLQVGDHIKVSGLYVLDYSHTPYCDLHSPSWRYLRGFYLAGFVHSELHPYTHSSVELMTPDAEFSEVHTTVAPIYPEVYTKTYLWNKWFGVAGHMVDPAKQETVQATFTLKAPARPEGDVELKLSVDDVVQTGNGTANITFDATDPNGIQVTVTAVGTDVLNPVVHRAKYTAMWVARNPQPGEPPDAGGDTMRADSVIRPGESIHSGKGQYTLIFQGDGNLVLYRAGGVALWATGTNGKPVTLCRMQADGNLVLEDSTGRVYWASGTSGNPGSRLTAQDDGNLVIYRSDDTASWASNTVIPSGPSAKGDTIPPGAVLYPGQAIVSKSGNYTITLQADGNLVLYDRVGHPLWASGTNGRSVAVCIMQTDGNLVLYGVGAVAIWASHTSQNPGSTLTVQDDGNAVIYRSDHSASWASNTVIPPGPTAQGTTMRPGEALYPGQSIVSANGNYTFTLQADGNLVLYYRAGVAMWASGTNGKAVGVCIMQTDGNLVLYGPGPLVVWASHTSRNSGSSLVVQDDGNVVIYRSNHSPSWATNTAR